MLEMLQHEEKIVGLKQSVKALHQNKVKTLYIAEDADKHLTQHIEQLAKEKDVEVMKVDSMKKLGKACGIDVGAAAVVVLR